jgi:hypothetical protein
MAKTQTSRGRKQDGARVAGGQDYEVGYEAKKTGQSRARVKQVGQEGRQQPQARRARAAHLRSALRTCRATASTETMSLITSAWSLRMTPRRKRTPGIRWTKWYVSKSGATGCRWR